MLSQVIQTAKVYFSEYKKLRNVICQIKLHLFAIGTFVPTWNGTLQSQSDPYNNITFHLESCRSNECTFIGNTSIDIILYALNLNFNLIL